MLRKIWYIGIALMLLISIVPAIAADPTGTPPTPTQNPSANVAKVGAGPAGGQEKVVSIQIGAVKYGPITNSATTQYYYIGWGGSFTGTDKPVQVAGLSIPYTSPYYGKQQFSISTLSNYETNGATYVTITRNYPYTSGNLTGAYINLIGVKLS